MLDKNKDWLVVRYKINEYQRFIKNLQNQDIQFYIPRIFINTKKDNIKLEILFPGYGFIQSAQTNFQALRNTLGLLNIIKFGDRFAVVENSMINQFKQLECSSKIQPIIDKQFIVGDEIFVNSGPFKGYMSKIMSVPKRDRITILISILGTKRILTIPTSSLVKE